MTPLTPTATSPEPSPPPSLAQLNHLVTLLNEGSHAEVESRARLLLEQYPDFGFAWKLLGVALYLQGKEAVPALQRATELLPDAADAHNNLGNALLDLGQINNAQASYQRAIEIRLDFADAHNNLANALATLGQNAAAAASYRRALATQPDHADAHTNLGNVLQRQNLLDEAEQCHRRALAIRPRFAEAHNNLANVQQALGQLGNAAGSYRKALTIRPSYAAAHSGLLFCMTHDGELDPQTVFAAHCRFGDVIEASLRARWPQGHPPHNNAPSPERRLQVGFVSGDLRDHVVAHFMEPLFLQLAQSPGLCLHAYYNHGIEDQVTQRLRGHLHHWHPIAGLTDDALAQKIRADGIDILIDLSGHTAKNRLLVFARKPAPIQVSWLGYPNTTGLRAMDYILCDQFNAPVGLYEQFHFEKFARLPSCGTFNPAANAPPINTLPALNNGYVTFGSFNRASKLGEQVIETWCKVLKAVTGSRLLLAGVDAGSLTQQLTQRFARHGIASDRLMFLPKVPMQDYLALHHQVDIILDTWPYTGGTTTNHALWMGVPVVTLRGPSRVHCQSAAVLGRLGLGGWAAGDVAEFVQIAVHWAHAPHELARLRLGMRELWLTAPLRQQAAVGCWFEEALRAMWQRWCAGLPADHFEIKQHEAAPCE